MDVTVAAHDVDLAPDVIPTAPDVAPAPDVGRRHDVGRPVAVHGVTPSRICLLIQ